MKLRILSILSLTLLFAACSKDEFVNPNVLYGASLSGANEVPSNSSAATGFANLLYNNNTKLLTVTVNYSGMTATAMHIHKGAAGANGGVIIGLGAAPYSSPYTFEYSVPLTQSQLDSMNAGLYYVNVHSAARPGGEIRGQITK
jgi:hypothetical protein